MTGLGPIGRLVLIGLPLLWLALFFLLPLLIVFKISLAESTIGIPPYTPLFANHGGGVELHATWANFALIAGDDLYLRAYLDSLGNAALATALCLLIGYPVAYAIARSQGARRQLLLFLVMLPFALLSGLATPLSNIPSGLQMVTLLNPLRYAIEIAERVYLEGADLRRIFPDLWPLAAIAAVTLSASSWLFRNRLT